MSDPNFTKLKFDFRNGFAPTQPQSGLHTIPDTYIEGLNTWLQGARVRSDRGTTSLGASGGPRPIMLARNLIVGMTGGGTVLNWLADWFVGQGNLVLPGGPVATSGGVLMVIVGGVALPAGLAAPTKPTVGPHTVPGILNGSYGVAVAPYRSTTGAVGSRSPISDIFAVKNMKAHYVFPTPVAGQTHWLLGGTTRGTGSTGLARFLNPLQHPPVPIATLSVDVDWLDGDLGALMQTNLDPPPSGITHCAVIGKCMVVFTSNGKVYVSLVGFPEAFPPEFVTSLPVRETVTGCNSDTIDGSTILSTANSFCGLFAAQASDVPVIIRPLLRIGCAQGNAWCIVYDQIYGFTDGIGFFRSQGSTEPDTSFAAVVQQHAIDNGWTSANTHVCNAPNNGAVLYAGPGGMLAYMMSGMEAGRWSGPFSYPGGGTPQGAVTQNGIGKIDVSGTLYSWDSAGAGGAAFVRSPQQWFEGKLFTTDHMYAGSSHDCTIDALYIPDGGSTPVSVGSPYPWAFTAPSGGNAHVLKPYRKVRNLGLRVDFTGGNKEFYGAVMAGYLDPDEERF